MQESEENKLMPHASRAVIKECLIPNTTLVLRSFLSDWSLAGNWGHVTELRTLVMYKSEAAT